LIKLILTNGHSLPLMLADTAVLIMNFILTDVFVQTVGMALTGLLRVEVG
jgi:hypothetical protein